MNKLIIKAYLKEHTRYAFAYGLGILILFSLAGLYEYDRSVRNMSYGLIIIAFFAVVYGIYDFIRYKKKCLELMDTALAVGERDYHLPDAGCLPEHIYQKMVHEEARERRRVVSEYDEKRGDMADYYTMWIHQIKTPIAAMRLLLEDRADGTGLLAGQQAAEELFKIEQYAEMALCYARLDSLSSDLLFKKYNVYGILKQAVKKYAVLFIGSGFSFSMEEFAVQAVTDEKWQIGRAHV